MPVKCRHCASDLEQEFADLRTAPPSNALVSPEGLGRPETYHPLRVMVCSQCWLVQLPDHELAAEIFSPKYAYFSLYSSAWLDHAQRYCAMITERLHLDPSSFVVEVASNDGYLLKNFVASGVPCLGIEPSTSTSRVAREAGIDVVESFFGEALGSEIARDRRPADLIIGNNVLAHVPDIDDFLLGVTALLGERGVATFEFPHLLNLIEKVQFDTIYHEHFSYLSLVAVERIANSANLKLWDVEKIPTHGGSLRIYLCRGDAYQATPAVAALRDEEVSAGLTKLDAYAGFQARIDRVALDLQGFLLERARRGERVMGYGAAAKASTLLNYAGISRNLLPAIADASPHKQGRYVPGVRIPIVAPEAIRRDRPDYVVIFPWNIREEIIEVLSHAREWGARFVTAVPSLEVI